MSFSDLEWARRAQDYPFGWRDLNVLVREINDRIDAHYLRHSDAGHVDPMIPSFILMAGWDDEEQFHAVELISGMTQIAEASAPALGRFDWVLPRRLRAPASVWASANGTDPMATAQARVVAPRDRVRVQTGEWVWDSGQGRIDPVPAGHPVTVIVREGEG